MNQSTVKLFGNRVVNVGFDVSADTLNWTVIVGDWEQSGECANRTVAVQQGLLKIHSLVTEHLNSSCELRIICESTGVYHRLLQRIARQAGMRTNLVSGEAVAQCRKLSQNDGNKTDLADPKAILTVAQLGRLLKDRQLDDQWAMLRELHRIVMVTEEKIRVLKNELHAELKTLFPDLKLVKEVIWGPTGRALFKAFGCHPSRIVERGRERFGKAIKKLSKHTKKATLEKIWQMAVDSHSQSQQPELLKVIEQQVSFQFACLQQLEQEKDRLESAMEELYDELRSVHLTLPEARKGVFTKRLLARLFAEIGPPEDFQSIRQLYRYAGLNLLERQSGKYRGKTKISRRGRARIRDILNRMSLPLVKKIGLFGDYYHAKKDQGMPGNKAMVAVMRKVLKLIYGMVRSGAEYDSRRVQLSQKEYEQMVA